MAKLIKNVQNEYGIKNWQLALAVGIPVFTVVGVIAYKQYKKKKLLVNKNSNPDKNQNISDEFELAQLAKKQGNDYFRTGNFLDSIECYSNAINICPEKYKEEISTFYQNRAAAYEQLKNFAYVIRDCTQALVFNKKYIKALNRRAKAYEQLGYLEEGLEDITAVCILENFINTSSLIFADSIVKELGQKKTLEKLKNKSFLDPSPQFVRNYFLSFANDPIFGLTDEEKQKYKDIDLVEENLVPFERALKEFKSDNYKNLITLCGEEIANTDSPYSIRARLFRATINLFIGDSDSAVEDLTYLLEIPNLVKEIRSNALIKLGSLKMQMEKNEEAMIEFDKAIEVDLDNPDVFLHRGQLKLVIGKWEEAVNDFKKSLSLNETSPLINVQKCFTELRYSLIKMDERLIDKHTEEFESTLKKYPTCTEGYALFGQVLVEHKNYERADELFKQAIEIEPDNSNLYVHRGLLRLQWKEDIDEAVKMMLKAIEIDDKSGFAFQALGTIEFQRGSNEKAVEYFNKAIELSRSEVELRHLYSLLSASLAQAKIAKNYGITSPPIF